MYKKLNPCWWLKNDDQPMPMPWDRSAHPFLANWPEWKVRLWWYWRNPLHNFTHYVIGIADRPEILENRTEHKWGDWTVLWPFPWVHYDGRRIEFYVGWRSWGAFGAAFRVHTR